MLARVGTSLSPSLFPSLECNRYWSILFSTSPHIHPPRTPHNLNTKYIHTASKAKAVPTKTHPKKHTTQTNAKSPPPNPKSATTSQLETKQEESTPTSTLQTIDVETNIQPIHPKKVEKTTQQSSNKKNKPEKKGDKNSIQNPQNTQNSQNSKRTQPLSVQSMEGDDEGDDGIVIIRYRPTPSVPPKRVPFTTFLARAKANKVHIVDIPADTPRKEFFEILKYLPGKTSLRDLTVRVKEISVAQAALLSKILQTCENLQSFRIFSSDFYGPAGVQTLNTLTKGILNSEGLDNLSLENCKISAPGWEIIAEWMHKTTKLKTVDLKRTRMTGDYAQSIQLVEAIKTNENGSFEKLDWDQNMTNDATVAFVLRQLAAVDQIQNISIKNYDVYRHNWNHTLLQVESKNEEKRDLVRAEIEKHKDALKEEFVPKPISTFHSNENEYINPKDTDRLQRKEKESKIMKAYEEFDYLKGATDREILKRIKLLKKRTQSKRGAVVKLK